MKYYIEYLLLTKENIAFPMTEEFDDKDVANKRYVELKRSGFCFQFNTRTDEPARRVILAEYTPHGKKYTFEVDSKVRVGDALWDSVMEQYIRALTPDHYEPESEISKRFPIEKLRSAMAS